jgi:hypothetical protein
MPPLLNTKKGTPLTPSFLTVFNCSSTCCIHNHVHLLTTTHADSASKLHLALRRAFQKRVHVAA